eukprot:comp19565_c0_seq1/m.22974 comp19565_c0_seq1/g.22974  ORF comp19565_c0_seq1/g.22974 comp19565_c0_seq1/m.22974 type:complete len:185 (-) comp19565_c0_seq1:122-676(-)
MTLQVMSLPANLLGPWGRRWSLRREQRKHVRTHLRRLHERLDPLGLTQVFMKDDGNCQFRALAHQIYGSQDFHQGVRQALVNYMEAHSEMFSFYFDGPAGFRAYLDRMQKPGEWGDEITLNAACNCFCVEIRVFTSSQSQSSWLLKYVPNSASKNSRLCTLSYIEPIHYNSVVPVQMATALDGA